MARLLRLRREDSRILAEQLLHLRLHRRCVPARVEQGRLLGLAHHILLGRHLRDLLELQGVRLEEICGRRLLVLRGNSRHYVEELVCALPVS